MVQEHNLKDKDFLCREFLDKFDVYLNPAVSLKGGTAIFVSKRLDYKYVFCNMSADSRIISLKIRVNNNKQDLQLVNVYAPANVTQSERDLRGNSRTLRFLKYF